MKHLFHAAVIGMGIGLLAGCGGSQENAQPAVGKSTARVSDTSGVSGRWGDTGNRQDTRGAKTQDEKNRGRSTTGVHVDPSLMSACSIPSANAFFEFDSATIKGDEENTLSLVAKCLSTGPLAGQSVEVVGHADPRGTDEYNYELGRSRAQSVLDYLSTRGLDASKGKVISYGESMSTATDEQGWAWERRVDLRLVR